MSHPIRKLLFDGHDPYLGFRPYVQDLQGWGGTNPRLPALWEEAGGGGVAAEIGVWKGQSAIHLARRMREKGKGHLVAIDTFTGSVEHWTADKRQFELVHGRPDLYQRFLTNVVTEGLQDWITPFPVPSDVAAQVFAKQTTLRFDYVYLDASHDYESVQRDLANWLPLVRSGGILAGDDYPYPGVMRAVNEALVNGWMTKLRTEGRVWWTVVT